MKKQPFHEDWKTTIKTKQTKAAGWNQSVYEPRKCGKEETFAFLICTE